MTDKILLVDDERDIVDLIEDVLRKDGFSNIEKAYTGQDAIRLCHEFQPDAIILDVMLPDANGIELCREIRSFSHCPVLFLSSKNDDVDIILGLSACGDDYVTKPFSPKEIVYRVKSQLRRAQYARADAAGAKRAILTLGPLSLDTDASIAYKNGSFNGKERKKGLRQQLGRVLRSVGRSQL